MTGYMTYGDFEARFSEVITRDNLDIDTWSTTFGYDMIENLYLEYSSNDAVTDPLLTPFILLDGLAKCIYSLILTDLGQSVETNFLASPQRTLDFFNKTSQIQNVPESFNSQWTMALNASSDYTFNTRDDPANLYQWAKTGIPHVDPTVIAMPYLCQVPRLKPVGTLIISILVADLVFLQTLWTLLNWFVTTLLERRHSDAKYCLGCSRQMNHEGGPATQVYAVSSPSKRYEPIPSLSFENAVSPVQSAAHSFQDVLITPTYGSELRNRSEASGRPCSSGSYHSYI